MQKGMVLLTGRKERGWEKHLSSGALLEFQCADSCYLDLLRIELVDCTGESEGAGRMVERSE